MYLFPTFHTLTPQLFTHTHSLPCIPGEYQNEEGAPSCKLCAAGYVSQKQNSQTCEQCGTDVKGESSEAGESSCSSCNLGRYQSAPGVCEDCPLGFFQHTRGEKQCLDVTFCPLGKLPNLVTKTGCEAAPWGICVLGEYLHDEPPNNMNQWTCRPCPQGADCDKTIPYWSTMAHKPEYWTVPKEWDESWGQKDSAPFVKCPFPARCGSGTRLNGTSSQHNNLITGNATTNTSSCLYNSKLSSPACAVCKDNHYSTADKKCLPCEQMGASTAENLSIFLSVLLILAIIAFIKREKIKELRTKYANVWRDMLRIFTISLSYTQINSSLPMMITVPWPQEYLDFLEKVDFVNFDLMSILGFGCVSGMDYRFRAIVTCSIPLLVLLVSLLSYLCRQQPNEKDPAVRLRAITFIFDSVDFDQNGSLDVNEFQSVLQQMGQKDTTVMHTLSLMREWNGGGDGEVHGAATELSRETFLDAAANDSVAESLGTHWVRRAESQRTRSARSASLLLIFFLLHAPISQRMFYYFACDDIGKKAFLRADYSIECNVPSHTAFMPFIFVVLVLFTVGLPLVVLLLLCKNRKKLYTPKVQQVRSMKLTFFLICVHIFYF